MAAEETPLDERQWSFPAWLENPMWSGLHSNSVLWYFSESPFYDRMSNNAVLMQQLSHNDQLMHILFNRELFEARMRSMSGMEFVVSEQPTDPGPNGTGVWVIRKQNRVKGKAGEADVVIILNTYHIVEGKIYMAPSAADLLKRSMLSIVSSVNRFMAAAAPLPDFSPALGHRYLPPPSNRLKATESQPSQGSKEPTPLPGATADNKKAPAPTNPNASNYLESRLLDESLDITMKYGDEYMDENPITGQPGEFHLSTTGRKEKDKLALPVVPVKAPAPAPPAKTSAVPMPLKTDIPPARKGSKAEKNPRTPGMPKPKRRKSSKVAGSGSGSITPV